ncbi:MAG: rod shape-determining protein MreC [Desulfuromonadales bacterium]
MNFIRKHLYLLLLSAGILVSLVFFSLNVPRNREANSIERLAMNIAAPLLKPVYTVCTSAEDMWDGYVRLVDTHRENIRLRDDVRKLNERAHEDEEVRLQNQRLERLLDMKKAVKLPMVSASVIGEDATPWFRTLVINRGTDSGLREGMAVLAADGAVGQVVKIASSTARVILLTDSASGISATIQRSRARGVVKGKGEMLCSLEFTTRDEDVKVGDLVVTSGIGGVFPKGLPIGEVTMVKRGEYGIFQTVMIRPAVNLAHVEEVLIVMRNGHE